MPKAMKLVEDQVTNGGEATINLSYPYRVELTIEGSSGILFHRWNNDEVKVKADAVKGSIAKKTDNVESYVYRDANGDIALPGEYLRQAIITAAKFQQDPRSPRKSAMDLTKAAVISLTDLASLGVDRWDFEDRRRVTIQRAAITRTRPGLHPGWKATIQLQVNLPEYVDPIFLRKLVDDAGRLIGVGDFRPTFGRFTVANWEILEA